MPHLAAPTTPVKPSTDTPPLAAGGRILEAAIATLVLSVFAASSPTLFTAQLAAPQVTTAKSIHAPKNQILSLQDPSQGRGAASPAAVQSSYPHP